MGGGGSFPVRRRGLRREPSTHRLINISNPCAVRFALAKTSVRNFLAAFLRVVRAEVLSSQAALHDNALGSNYAQGC